VAGIAPAAQRRPVGRLRKALSILFTLAFAAVAALLAGGAYAYVRLPALKALPQMVRAQLKAHHSRWVPLQDVAPGFIRALLATEDTTFWTNPGVSFEGIARSVLVDIASGRFVEGGSTLTQQLVRDELLSLQKTVPRKLEEMDLAIALTRLDSTREILALYLNEVYLGHGAYGIYAAAETYCGRTPAQLTPAQSTLLAGLPAAPSYYDPLTNPEGARERQAQVVAAMENAGVLTVKEGHAILRAPWGLR
jgi:penicillin-binding protein 1A